MNKLAEKLNESLKNTQVYSMLSDYGRRMYVPNGIIVQGAEAKKRANKYNVTVGVALDHGKPVFIQGLKKQFASDMDSSDIFSYAPMGGVMALRQAWQDEMRRKNPLLENVELSLPVVCSGLTNALSIAGSLFIDEGDEVVLHKLYWENYDLLLNEQFKAKKVLYDNFDGEGFNVRGLDEAITSTKGTKVIVLLNFPNNPTGYTPTNEESEKIAAVLKKHADMGKKLVVITDDAYYGLFFEKDVCTQSIFSKVCNASENILAIKCDGATKEEMVWGFRVAFITYSFKGCDSDSINSLVQKTMGVIRGTLSSCSMPSQSIILKGMKDPDYQKDKQAGIELIAKRYELIKNTLKNYKDKDCLKPYPFNSGYFMSFETKCNAEELRQLLLEKYGTGVICLSENLIRVAFSSIDIENVEDLIRVIYTAAEELSQD